MLRFFLSILTVDAAILGSDRDAHGCIQSAGYQWCDDLGECCRPWEEETYLYDCVTNDCCLDVDIAHCETPCIISDGRCMYADLQPELDIARPNQPCNVWDAYDCSHGNPCVMHDGECVSAPPPQIIVQTFYLQQPPLFAFVVVTMLFILLMRRRHAEHDSHGGSTVNAIASAAGLERK